MKRNGGLKVTRGILSIAMVMFLALWAWPGNQAAALVIDDMEIQFGDAAVPAAQALPPSPSTDSNFQMVWTPTKFSVGLV